MGKGGGGGSGTPKIGIPPALGSNPGSLYYNAFEPLGTFGSSELGSLQGLTNWAENIATGGNVLGDSAQLQGTGMLSGGGGNTFAPFTNFGTGGGTGGGGLGAGENSLLGPFLSNAVANLQNEQGATGLLAQLAPQLSQEGNTVFGQGTSMLNKGTHMLNQATNGSGLFPSQQAMINQAVQSQQAATQQQLSNEGLGTSTVNAGLQGQIKLSGAAAAGQLVQQNISLAEGEQQLGVGTEQTGAGIQQASAQVGEALFSEYSNIAQQSAGLQAQMFQQAMQGVGALGNMMNATLQPFGYAMTTQQDVLQANETEAGLQAKDAQAAEQAAQQGSSSLMSGLGSLFGQSGTGGILGIGGQGGLFGSSGLFSSIGGALGLGGAAGGTGALGTFTGGGISTAIAGGTAAAGGSGALAGIGGALTALFCQVARTVYGIDDPRWFFFREYLLFRAPRSFRQAYIKNASWVSRLVRKHAWLKQTIKQVMNLVIWYDKATRAL